MLVNIHGWRTDQRGLLRTPAWRVFIGMGNEAWGASRLLARRFVSDVKQEKVTPCLPAGRGGELHFSILDGIVTDV